MNRLLTLLIALILASCSNYGQLTFLAKLPRKLNENSGLVVLDSTSVWFIEDGSNADNIYEVSLEGEMLKEFEVSNADNDDWEDLADDPSGSVYIADTGNNAHDRKELVIYKIPDPRKEPGDKIKAEQIRFRYPSLPDMQQGSVRHDSEALFYRDGFLYVITKDRARPFTGTAMIFKIPAEAGLHEARFVGSFVPCRQRGICEVTAADISPDGTKIVLLGYGQLWLFTDFQGDDFTSGRLTTYNLGATTQLESVGFLDGKTLLLSDEKLGATGRNLYRYSLD